MHSRETRLCSRNIAPDCAYVTFVAGFVGDSCPNLVATSWQQVVFSCCGGLAFICLYISICKQMYTHVYTHIHIYKFLYKYIHNYMYGLLTL